jgi:hypothetical protein
MKRTIINPHWINNARTTLAADFQYSDGSVVHAVISKSDGNPDYNEILKTFSEEVINTNTGRNAARVNVENEARAAAQEAQKVREKQEALFAAKLDAFEIDVVKESSNTVAKAKIRQSKTPIEVVAWTAILLMNEAATPPTE